MKFLSCTLIGAAIAAAALFSSGCATDAEIDANRANNRVLPGQNQYSNMPQNLPQSWEGQGMLGGMAGYQ